MIRFRNTIFSFLIIPFFCFAEDSTKNAIQHDYELNIAYENAMKSLDDPQKKKLRDAQRLWIKYRDATCDFENNLPKTGHWIEENVSNLKSLECISRLSLVRTNELNQYVESTGGEPSPLSWKTGKFSFPEDALSCHGKQLVRFDDKYKLYVGLTFCNETDEFRLYLSRDGEKSFLPAADTGGHGQDHCELVNPKFTLPNTDNINSGGCKSCATSRNLPLENVDVWSRSNLGQTFNQIHTGTWSNQTSRLKCGVDFGQCFLVKEQTSNISCYAKLIN